MKNHYILDDNHKVVKADLMTWANWYETANRTVKKTDIGDVKISTVFLGLDHNFGKGPPLIFETMIFGGEHNEEMDRYSTWQKAEKGHENFVKKVRDSEK